MVDTFTTTTGNWSPLVQTAFDTAVNWYLNDAVFFRTLVDKRPVAQAMPGVTVTLTILGQLPVNSTPLTENLDVDAQAMPAPRQVSITLNEYGNAVTTTAKLERTAFTGTVVGDVSREIATNMVESLDPIYRGLLDNAANKLYIHTNGTIQTTDPVASTGPITAKGATAAVTLLRGRKADPTDGMNYVAYIHPDVSFDLRTEAGSAWTAAHTYEDTEAVYRGEVGTFQGARYIETPRCLKTLGTPNVYNSYYLGREGLVELVGTEPGTRVGPIVDKLSRFRPLGWYAMFGANRFRENALELMKTASTIGSLAGAYDPKA